MLVAVANSGRRQVASSGVRGEQFHCPDCGTPLVVRIPKTRVAHFAHLPGNKCAAKRLKATRRAEKRARAVAARLRRRQEEDETLGQGSLFAIPVPGGPAPERPA